MGEAQELCDLVAEFSAEMEKKLLSKKKRGWWGWDQETAVWKFKRDLMSHLISAIEGDAKQWIDVANFAAFLWWLEARGEK